MASTATTASTGGHGPEATRRDFLFIATATVGAVGAAASPGAAGRPDESRCLDAGRRRAGRSRRQQDRGRSAGHDPLAGAADLRLPPLQADARFDAERADGVAALRPEFGTDPAAALCHQLAPLDQAGIRHAGRHLHPSRLHSAVLSDAERDDAGGELAGRLFLPLPRLEIRSGRPRLLRRAGAVQSAGAALPLRQCHDAARRRERSERQAWDFDSIRQL